MALEEKVLKGEDFIREALPSFLEIEEERKGSGEPDACYLRLPWRERIAPTGAGTRCCGGD